MSPVAEVIKELGTLLVATAGLATSVAGLVSILKTKKLVNNRTDQLLEAVQYKGMVKGLEVGVERAREDRKELLEVAKLGESPKDPPK